MRLELKNPYFPMRETAALLKRSVVSAASSYCVLKGGRTFVASFPVRKLVCLTSHKGNLRPLFTQPRWHLVGCPLAFSLRSYTDVSSSHDSQGNKTRKHSNVETHYNDDEDSIIRKCKWDSPEFPERLGFASDEPFDEYQLRRNYRILVKFFHPDSPTAPQQHATEAFQKIKEAYDALSFTLRGDTNEGNFRAGDHQNAQGMTFADEARRRAQMRFLGDGIILFLLMTLFYIYMVSRHNAKRLGSYNLWHFAGIFFIIQLFPRLLAAAVLFACHTTYLIANAELTEQSAATILLRQGDHDMRMQLQGIPSKEAANVVIQVVVSVPKDIAASPAATRTKEDTEHLSKGASALLHSTTLTFDKGVLDVVIPLPPKGFDQKTTYSVKAVDEARKFVLVDKTFSVKA
ncbi:unnamed protein product [Phytomonas sp. EM1]|nr:unnamed protein product [Phytomonas sp. EM1]|eukprot:CCW60001.1 unnamed protein product [Phytomonas sp. isolate EM1]